MPGLTCACNIDSLNTGEPIFFTTPRLVNLCYYPIPLSTEKNGFLRKNDAKSCATRYSHFGTKVPKSDNLDLSRRKTDCTLGVVAVTFKFRLDRACPTFQIRPRPTVSLLRTWQNTWDSPRARFPQCLTIPLTPRPSR